jgi:hypothetical protein
MSESMTITEGQRVAIDHHTAAGCVFTVERVKYTKAIVRPADDATRARYPRGLDAPLTMLRPLADGEAPAPVGKTPEQRLAELEQQMQFVPGVLVQLKRPFGGHTAEDVFVVIANNERTVSAAKIGGDDGRYIRAAHNGLSIVSVRDGLRLDANGHLLP